MARLGIDIHGWVELKHYLWVEDEPEEGLSPWAGVISLGSFPLGNYAMFELLFGAARGRQLGRQKQLGNYFPHGKFELLFGAGRHPLPESVTPVAADRGLPPDPSCKVAEERKGIEACGYTGWNDYGHSWIGWEEIAAIDWDEEIVAPPGGWGGSPAPGRLTRRELLDDDWACLFRMMAALAETYGGDKVRMVVWFDG